MEGDKGSMLVSKGRLGASCSTDFGRVASVLHKCSSEMESVSFWRGDVYREPERAKFHEPRSVTMAMNVLHAASAEERLV